MNKDFRHDPHITHIIFHFLLDYDYIDYYQ